MSEGEKWPKRKGRSSGARGWPFNGASSHFNSSRAHQDQVPLSCGQAHLVAL